MAVGGFLVFSQQLRAFSCKTAAPSLPEHPPRAWRFAKLSWTWARGKERFGPSWTNSRHTGDFCIF